MKLTVSVVIPAYNEAKDIAKCLDALMRQTIAPDEIIVVDNNSTDNTSEVASTYKSVRIIKEKQKGITYARTAGFNAAKCDIIARIDADTIACDNWIKSITDKFSKADESLCGITGKVAVRELSPGATFMFSPIHFLWRKLGDIVIHPTVGKIMSGHNMAIRKSVWDKISNLVHLGDKDINEDVDLSLFVKRFGRVEYCHKMLVKTKMIEMFFNISKIKRYARANRITFKKHMELDRKQQIPRLIKEREHNSTV